jgi:hypothetical protein
MRRGLRLLTVLALYVFASCAPEGPGAFVTFNLPPSVDCTYSVATTEFYIPTGLYDVYPGDRNGCANRSYFVHLQVNSYLRPNSDATLGRAEPNILQLGHAEVRLMDIGRNRIVFGEGSDALANPFSVTTNNSLPPSTGDEASTGIATVEAIPSAYASFFNNEMFLNQQILAEIQIFGTTTGDVDIDFKPFVYPIEICSKCLVRCLNRDITAMMLERDDLVGDECDDDSGADGRYCIDQGC